MSLLPSQFKQCEYIESPISPGDYATSNLYYAPAYINTGVGFGAYRSYYLDFEITGMYQRVPSYDIDCEAIFGSNFVGMSGHTYKYGVVTGITKAYKLFDWGGTAWYAPTSVTIGLNERHTLYTYPSDYQSVEEVLWISKAEAVLDGDESNPITVFGGDGSHLQNISDPWTTTWHGLFCNHKFRGTTDAGAWDFTPMKLYACSIYDADESEAGFTTVRDFVPCINTVPVTSTRGVLEPAKTPGLYDLVEGKFYTNPNRDVNPTKDFIYKLLAEDDDMHIRGIFPNEKPSDFYGRYGFKIRS